MLRVPYYLATAVFTVFLTISCGSAGTASGPHTTEAGTTPVSASTADTFHGTYRLAEIYSSDLSIVKAQGTQYVDSEKNRVRIELEISTLLDTYKIEREYPIEFGKSSFSLASAAAEEYGSENQTGGKTYFIDSHYLAEISDFQAFLNIEWQKVSDRINGKI
ncbi:MAG: hypothetical protein AB7E48_03375 [Deferribacterales bacterium]